MTSHLSSLHFFDPPLRLGLRSGGRGQQSKAEDQTECGRVQVGYGMVVQ